jgi:dienelactone hydrolase
MMRRAATVHRAGRAAWRRVCSVGWSAVLALAFGAGPTAAQTAATVPSLDAPRGTPLLLTAQWFPVTPPPGRAAPAMVLLHGCGGPYARNLGDGPLRRLGERERWTAERLNALGIHVLVLDSLTARGETELCTQRIGTRAVTQAQRRRDALGALKWLSGQSGVDAARLGVLGWSNGGSTVLAATNGRRPEVRQAVARASLAVAFYPGCETDRQSGYEATASLLLLVGSEDDWTPAAPCQALAAESGGAPIELAVFEGAHHGFDGAAAVRLRRDVPNGANPGQGVHAGGHPPSREAARERLVAFIRAHWLRDTP